MKTALVAGATGLIGRHLVQILSQDEQCKNEYETIIVLARRTTAWPGSSNRIRSMVSDFSRLDKILDSARIKPEHIYCALGTTQKKAGSKEAFYQVDHDFPLLLAQWARANGAQKMAVVSSMGANSQSMSYYLRVKGEMEQDLQKINLQTLHIVRPSLLLGKREDFRFGEEIGKKMSGLISPFMAGPLKDYKPVQGKTVAQFLIQKMLGTDIGMHIWPSGQIK